MWAHRGRNGDDRMTNWLLECWIFTILFDVSIFGFIVLYISEDHIWIIEIHISIMLICDPTIVEIYIHFNDLLYSLIY